MPAANHAAINLLVWTADVFAVLHETSVVEGILVSVCRNESTCVRCVYVCFAEIMKVGEDAFQVDV